MSVNQGIQKYLTLKIYNQKTRRGKVKPDSLLRLRLIIIIVYETFIIKYNWIKLDVAQDNQRFRFVMENQNIIIFESKMAKLVNFMYSEYSQKSKCKNQKCWYRFWALKTNDQ
ncbi:Hypothetical_protein [Hexamita inflata]|uniref:Hypothetical_protein n=1 Tax=Hexamita inflata TaxID=28002 RepID=A0AA86P2V0_9EUKA|nr:Hypothetical protein HINF_LOCUS17810 [Hexamita inflata]